MRILGIDTSNYTTSAALYDSDTDMILQQKQLLPVKPGERGLRQSDAVFHHTVQLPQIVEKLFSEASAPAPDAVCASAMPRRAKGSYMPCFLVGDGFARALSACLGVPRAAVSHQEGHIAAALYSAGALSLLDEPFFAFHISGGTTEALLVRPDTERCFLAECVARSLDLHAGQAVDRVGVLLGLDFPCGPALDKLAQGSERAFSVRPAMKGADCCLSGIENQCRKMVENGESAADVAKFCLESIRVSLEGMLLQLYAQYGRLPVLFSGGVASNSLLRRYFTERYCVRFAEPAFSADNAAGAAVLGALLLKGGASRAD